MFQRLLKNPEYRKRFAARWRELRKNQFSTASIHAMIDANVQALGAAAQRNAKRWGSRGDGDRPSFDQDVAEMKEWVTKRGAWLDARITEIAR